MARKIIASIISTILSTIFLLFLLSIGEDDVIAVSVVIALIVFVVTLFYGVPISILIHHLTKKFQETRRRLISLIYHLLFGFAFVLIISLIVYFDHLENLTHYWNETHFYFVAAIVASFFLWLTEVIICKLAGKKH
ncbi:hypothetical protein CBW46_017870 [Paenibacillus xerothermodurans]|uniref:Permease n=2 Tax=Paenibacillus xerothermodurans TaxID=1977292 RepID=A0A2W1N6Y5_PAEXE|nr:hypothetical protein CBW46_017870 [Paenibacillus xerothermodurans]